MSKKYFTWIPAFLFMCIIFSFSNKTATESTKSSSFITRSILNTYEKVFQVDLTEDEYSNISDKLETVVRKMAHMCEYAVLTILVFIHLVCCEVPLKKCLWIALLVAVMYAATDEFHQRFVAGRSCELRDVLIDSIGSTLGGISFYFVMKWKDRRYIKRERLSN